LDYIKTKQGKLFKPCTPVGKFASAYRPGTNEIMQPVTGVRLARLGAPAVRGASIATVTPASETTCAIASPSQPERQGPSPPSHL